MLEIKVKDKEDNFVFLDNQMYLHRYHVRYDKSSIKYLGKTFINFTNYFNLNDLKDEHVELFFLKENIIYLFNGTEYSSY